MGNVCISLNTRNRAITNYHNYIYNSLCNNNGVIYGSKDDGIYALGKEYDDDNGTDIDAYADTLDSDFDIASEKRLRSMNIRYLTNGTIILSYMTDRTTTYQSTVLPDNSTRKPHGRKVPGTRDMRGTYYRFRIENVDGADFTFNAIGIVPIVRNIGHSL